MGNKIDEEMKVDIMSRALPTSWGPFIVIHGADPTLSIKFDLKDEARRSLRKKF